MSDMTASDEDLIRRGDVIALMQKAVDGYGQKMRDAVDKKEQRDWKSMLFASVDISVAIAAIPAVQVAVKPLEWVDFADRGAKAQAWNDANYMIQKWSDGRCEISASYPGYSTALYGIDRFHPTIEAAKAAAQADYDARIRSALTAQPSPDVAALASLRAEHAEWSQRQFGDVSAIGPAKHLAKEALEVAADPTDAIEHADCWMLLWDMQRRAGITDRQLAEAISTKLAINKAREWPAPREGEAREHDRTQDAALARVKGGAGHSLDYERKVAQMKEDFPNGI